MASRSRPAVGRKALADNEVVLDPLGQGVVVEGDEPADVDQGVLLAAHGRAVRVGEHLLGDLEDALLGVVLLPLLDEPGVLGEAAGVQEERNVVMGADLARLFDVLEGYRLAAAAVIGHRQHDQRDLPGPLPIDERLQLGDVHVALERQVGVRIIGRRPG
jgi:hypothetical protein